MVISKNVFPSNTGLSWTNFLLNEAILRNDFLQTVMFLKYNTLLNLGKRFIKVEEAIIERSLVFRHY